MTQKQKETMYEDFKGMLIASAVRYGTRSGVPVDECKSQANLIFCEAVEKWDSSRASFSTLLHQMLEVGLYRFTKRWWKAAPAQERDEEKTAVLSSGPFNLVLDSITGEPKQVIDLVLDKPSQYPINQPGRVRGLLVREAREKFGWSLHTAHTSIKKAGELLAC